MGELNGKASGSSGDDGKVVEVCPYCKLRIVIDAKECTVMHARPTCRQFDEMDAYDFLKEVRRQVQHDVLSGEIGPLKVIKGGSA